MRWSVGQHKDTARAEFPVVTAHPQPQNPGDGPSGNLLNQWPVGNATIQK